MSTFAAGIQRWLAVAGSASVLLPVSGLPAAAEEPPPEERTCPVVAAAQGVHLMVSASDNILLEKPGGVSLPAAQSCVDYVVRESWSFAGAPYPGENMAALPASLRNSGLPVPDYPAYTSSRYPSSQRSAKSEHGYTLRASSEETSSESAAHTGANDDTASALSLAASAMSAVDPAAGTSRAHAESDLRPITIKGVLELGRIHSTATATMTRDGEVRRDSLLSVGQTSVAGQRVRITQDGIEAVGKTVDMPRPDPAAALEAAGITMRYLAASKTKRGVLSAGIEVLVRYRDAERGEAYQAHYALGRTFAAAAEVTANESGVFGGAVPTGTESGERGTGEARVPVAAASGPAPEESGVPSSAGAVSAPEMAPPPEVRAAPAPARLVGAPLDMGFAGLYLVIVFGALATVAGGTLLRLLGVKTRWTS
ncbi:MAG: hypothetical protein GEV04_13140 [Actinophytocola sp.]|nr:hypothetical protein [Actinophytocola sp.]